MEPKRNVALVFSGGASLGAAHVGLLQALADASPPGSCLLDNVKVAVGTSVGSIVAAMFALGYSPAQIYDIWNREVWGADGVKDANKLLDLAEADIWAARRNWRAFMGIFAGDRLGDVLRAYLDPDSEAYRRRVLLPGANVPLDPRCELYVVAVNFSNGHEVLFHYGGDAPIASIAGRVLLPGSGREAAYWVYEPGMSDNVAARTEVPVWEAVRCSIGMPGVFRPHFLRFKAAVVGRSERGVTCADGEYVDGGVRDMYPLSMAVKLALGPEDADKDGCRRALGMYLGGRFYSMPNVGQNGIVDVFNQSIEAAGRTIFEADQDDGVVQTASVRTVCPDFGPGIARFDPELVPYIYQRGYEATRAFLASIGQPPGGLTWDRVFARPKADTSGNLVRAVGRPAMDFASAPATLENYYVWWQDPSAGVATVPSPVKLESDPEQSRYLRQLGWAAFLGGGGALLVVLSLISKVLVFAARLASASTQGLERAIASPLFDVVAVLVGGVITWWFINYKLEMVFRGMLRDVAGVAQPRARSVQKRRR